MREYRTNKKQDVLGHNALYKRFEKQFDSFFFVYMKNKATVSDWVDQNVSGRWRKYLLAVKRPIEELRNILAFYKEVEDIDDIYRFEIWPSVDESWMDLILRRTKRDLAKKPTIGTGSVRRNRDYLDLLEDTKKKMRRAKDKAAAVESVTRIMTGMTGKKDLRGSS